jgi:hypothetical protein
MTAERDFVTTEQASGRRLTIKQGNMMKLNKILLLGGLLCSSTVFAGAWTEPLTIEDVSMSVYEGRFGAAQLRVTFDQAPVTSVCAATEKLAVCSP